MKKFFTLAALVAASLSLNAQETYNFFNLADVDAEGWLWLDSAEKLNKYCGTRLGEKKITLDDAKYELDDFSIPACELDATVKGYNSKGEKGGEGSKTGGIIFPESKVEVCTGSGQYGGGIMLQVPDLAELEVYVSSEQEKLYLTLRAGKKSNLRYADLKYITCYETSLDPDWEFLYPDTPLPGCPLLRKMGKHAGLQV